GAPAQIVVLIYLIQIAIIALVGILIGLVICALSPMLAAQFLAQFLPVSTTPTLYPGSPRHLKVAMVVRLESRKARTALAT
ncbi:hypothetical protein ACC687_41225, partial [Rhizobium ruizarguesonis]